MRPRFGAVLGLTLAAGLAVAGFARAEDAQTCEVPAYLLTTDSMLAKVADAVKNAPSVERAGGGYPLVDHRFLGRQRLPRAAAGRAEGAPALDPG